MKTANRQHRTTKLLGVGEGVIQFERKVDKHQKNLQAKLDHRSTGGKEEIYQCHHQMKQAVNSLQQARARNSERFWRPEAVVQELHEQAAQSGLVGVNPPLLWTNGGIIWSEWLCWKRTLASCEQLCTDFSVGGLLRNDPSGRRF